MKKRLFALLSAVIISIPLVSCAPEGSGGGKTNVNAVFPEPVTVTVMLPRSNQMFSEDWKVWEYIQGATGAELKLQAASADYESALAAAFATPETRPDLVAFTDKAVMDSYAAQGALIALENIEAQMPNWQSFWAEVDPVEKAKLFQTRRSADGKIYWPARCGFTNFSALKSWMYRRDIFEQHGLEIPATYDELYEVAKRLKELYPESYPISCQSFFTGIAQSVGPQWKRNFECWEYYDFAASEWCYGAREDTMLNMITVFKRFYDEGLMFPDFISSTEHEFSELVTTSKTFIFPSTLSCMNAYHTAVDGINPSFELAPMVSPVADLVAGTRYVTSFWADVGGLSIVNTADSVRMANAVKLFDWFYSPDARELLSWGREGETYETVDGEKQFILSPGEDVQSKYGFQTPGAAQVLDSSAVISHCLQSISEDDLSLMLSAAESNYNPKRWIALTAAEQETVSELGEEIRTYAQDMITKFLLGEAPLTEWDSFTEALNDMGVDTLLNVYNQAYSRVK